MAAQAAAVPATDGFRKQKSKTGKRKIGDQKRERRKVGQVLFALGTASAAKHNNTLTHKHTLYENEIDENHLLYFAAIAHGHAAGG